MLTEDQTRGLGVALNEAAWIDAYVDREPPSAFLSFGVLTLPEVGPEPAREDRKFWLGLTGVHRVALSLRNGRWDDASAPAEPMTLADLQSTLRTFNQESISGWDFFDGGDRGWVDWRDRLSLDEHLLPGESQHTLDLFQEGWWEPERILDFRIWFDELAILDNHGNPVDLQDFIDGGTRWWTAMRQGDPRVSGHGIVAAGDQSIEDTGRLLQPPPNSRPT